MPTVFRVELTVEVRRARPDDLGTLEWFGMMTPFRATIEDAFARSQRGEVVFLVAEANAYPIGQIWIDLTRFADERVGLIWAFRVIPTMQNLGIGTWLLQEAENVIREHRFATAELSVETSNTAAKRLYERLGYHTVREHRELWSVTTPDGKQLEFDEEEWIMRKTL
jgi:ribosomal protein S18 acetylase RimI-like enzyme